MTEENGRPEDEEGRETEENPPETTGSESPDADDRELGLQEALELLREGRADEIPDRLLDELQAVTGGLEEESETAQPESGETDEETGDRLAALEDEVAELREQLERREESETGEAVAELRETVAEHTQTITELESALDRHRSEFEEHREHAKRERERIRKYSIEEFALEMIRVKDSLENVLEFVHLGDEAQEQIELVDKQFEQTLERSNVSEVSTDGTFDLERHEVIDQERSEEHDPDEIVRVQKAGYQLNDRVLRPAKVVIAAPDS